MSVSVSFTNLIASRFVAIHEAVHAIDTGGESWDVSVSLSDAPEPECLLRLTGPFGHEREIHVFGEAPCHDADYIAALVRAEVRAFPSKLPKEYSFAVAELARIGVPYDDTDANLGRVVVEGVNVPVEHLIYLYRKDMLTAEVLGKYIATSK
jgi:hypothetical protein